LKSQPRIAAEESAIVIEVTVIGNWALVVLAGEFDVSNADGIRSVVDDLVADAVSDVVVDLTRVTFIGAAAVGALIGAYRSCSSLNGRMVLVGASSMTRRVFIIAGVDGTLPVVDLPLAPAPAGDEGPSDGELSGLLTEVSRMLLTEATVTGDLQAVVRAAVDLVPGCGAASVAVLAPGGAHSAAVSDRTAVAVDRAQYVTGEGPCLEAALSGDRIRFDVAPGDGRYVRFAPFATQAGVRAVLSMPVALWGVTIGSVNLYSPGALPPDADAMGWVMAAQVAAALVKSEITTDALMLAGRFQERMEIPRGADLAAGLAAGFERCSREQAGRLLGSPPLTANGSVAVAAERVIDHLGGAPVRP
jgi:anti-anti-sigma factor